MTVFKNIKNFPGKSILRNMGSTDWPFTWRIQFQSIMSMFIQCLKFIAISILLLDKLTENNTDKFSQQKYFGGGWAAHTI